MMPRLVLDSFAVDGERIRLALVDKIQTVEDKDGRDAVLAQEGNVIFNGLLVAERAAAKGMFERFFVVAVEAVV